MAAPKAAMAGSSDQDCDAILRALQGIDLASGSTGHYPMRRRRWGAVRLVMCRRFSRARSKAIRDGGLLEYYPLEDNRFELGGFVNLKSWLERAKGFTGRSQGAQPDPPRGIMLVGVPGCGKSLAAKVIAREWQPALCSNWMRAGYLINSSASPEKLSQGHRDG